MKKLGSLLLLFSLTMFLGCPVAEDKPAGTDDTPASVTEPDADPAIEGEAEPEADAE